MSPRKYHEEEKIKPVLLQYFEREYTKLVKNL